MNPAEYDRLFQNEDHYWWYVTRRELVVDLVRQLKLPRDARILDVGCGTGATAKALGDCGAVVGADFSPLALERSRRRGLDRLVLARAEGLPLRSGSFDALVATDIIEHIEDDLAALAEFQRVLRPGGYAVITVPAYQMLWSEHDVALMHKRRYVAGLLKQRIARAGFTTARLSYTVSLLLPLALLRLLKPKPVAGAQPEAQIWRLPAPLNAALKQLQRCENALLHHMSLPWGLSVVAVIQKPRAPHTMRGPHAPVADLKASGSGVAGS